MSKYRKKNSFKKVLVWLFLLVMLIGGTIVYQFYQKIYRPNVTLPHNSDGYFYIYSDNNLQDISKSLYDLGYIKNSASFEWVAQKKSNFQYNIHPGRYLLKDGMNNNDLVDLFRSGEQVPVKVTFNNVRTKEELAGKITRNLECDSASFIQLLKNDAFISKYGFNQLSVLTMFLPNTYFINWNTTAEELFQRMAKEYKKYWTQERKAKAKKLNLSQSEVSILASIVQAEQSVRADERPKVAGLYINRMRKGMLLQSDPTVIYGLGDFTITRVLTKHLEKDTPYNTYKYSGLPPGPINLPSIKSLNAVLDYQKHSYLYMCAKEDFSGYHNFAINYSQHLVNARKYQRELNKRKIYR